MINTQLLDNYILGGIKKSRFVKPIFGYLTFGIILIISMVIIYPWFKGEYTVNTGSFEPVYLFYARFIKDHFPGFTINPYWYLSFPNRYAFPPLFFYLITVLHYYFNSLSVPTIYHYLTGIFYILIPISLLTFLKSLRLSWFVTIITIILFLFYPATLYILPRLLAEVAPFYYPPFLLLSLTYFGTGPKIMALFFSFLGLACFYRYLVGQKKFQLITVVIISSIIFLTDQTTMIGYLIFCGAIFSSQALCSGGLANIKKLKWPILLTLGLVAWYYNLSYLEKLYFAPSLGGFSFAKLFSMTYKMIIIGLPLFLGLFPRRFVREIRNQPITFSLIAAFIYLVLVLTYYFENPQFLTEFSRFLVEFHLAFSLLIALFLERKLALGNPKKIFTTVILLIFPLVLFPRWQKLAETIGDVQSLREYQLFQKLKQADPVRVYATGAVSFWLNSFGGNRIIPQVRGGSDQAAIHKWWKDASFYIREGEDREITLNWLKALNVSQIIISNKGSREFYHNDWQNLDRFTEDYSLFYDNSGDKILTVPQNSRSLAQIVDKNIYPSLLPLQNVKDKSNLQAYIDWIDTNAKTVPIIWENDKKLVVSGDFTDQAGVSIQLAYDKKWVAYDDLGNHLKIKPDQIGNLYLEPIKSAQKIYLKWQESADIYFGLLISIITVIYMIKIILRPNFVNYGSKGK